LEVTLSTSWNKAVIGTTPAHHPTKKQGRKRFWKAQRFEEKASGSVRERREPLHQEKEKMSVGERPSPGPKLARPS